MYGQQENKAHNSHFEFTCYHPLLLFNRKGDCLAAEQRPGKVHSADDWEEQERTCWTGLRLWHGNG